MKLAKYRETKQFSSFILGLFLTSDFFLNRKETAFGMELGLSTKLLLKRPVSELNSPKTSIRVLMQMDKYLNSSDESDQSFHKLWIFTLKF